MANLRPYFLMMTGVLACVLQIDAGPGYLPALGPATLRFRSEPSPPPVDLMVSPSEPSKEKTEAGPQEQPESAPVGTSDGGALLSETPLSPATNQTVAPMLSPPPEEVVSPQSFLKYFNPDATNSMPTKGGPVGFTPPQPSIAPSSSATYTVTPKQ